MGIVKFAYILLAQLFAFSFSCPSLRAEDMKEWAVETMKGVEYVSVDQIEEFYRFEFQRREGNRIILENKKVEMSFHAGSLKCMVNGVKFLFENRIEDVDGKVYVSRRDLATLDSVLRPNWIGTATIPTTVILDASHGGDSKGLENELGTEAGYSLEIAKLAKAKLVAKGFEVLMTREDDRALLLSERVEIANAFKGDAVFVSIGFRSGAKDSQGFETAILSKHRDGAVNFRPMATALATGIHGTLSRRMKQIPDNGIRWRRFSVLSKVEHPAIVLEPGYMTHELDARFIDNRTYQEMIAGAITDGLVRYKFAARGAVKRRQAEGRADDADGE